MLFGDVPAPVHPEETKRLQTLYALNILDTEATSALDRITKLASLTLGTPIALFGLVDGDRQWFKSKQGLDCLEYPRSASFCAHAILGSTDEVFVVEDTHENEMFFNNHLVTGAPFIRFYAGCPVKAKNGLPMGTLCIIDREPRSLSEQQKQTLMMLAAQVEEQLLLVQQGRRLRDTLIILQQTQDQLVQSESKAGKKVEEQLLLVQQGRRLRDTLEILQHTQDQLVQSESKAKQMAKDKTEFSRRFSLLSSILQV